MQEQPDNDAPDAEVNNPPESEAEDNAKPLKSRTVLQHIGAGAGVIGRGIGTGLAGLVGLQLICGQIEGCREESFRKRLRRLEAEERGSHKRLFATYPPVLSGLSFDKLCDPEQVKQALDTPDGGDKLYTVSYSVKGKPYQFEVRADDPNTLQTAARIIQADEYERRIPLPGAAVER